MAIYLLYAHIISAFSSLALLVIRGVMQLNGQNWRAKKLLKIAPHLTDTLLIASGLAIFFMFNMLLEPWLMSKIALLIAYVFCSAKFFSKKQTQPKAIWFILALLCFSGAILVAYWH